MEIDDECYHSAHLEFLEEIIDKNAGVWEDSLAIKPLNLASAGGLLKWKNGKMFAYFVPKIAKMTKIIRFFIRNAFFQVRLDFLSKRLENRLKFFYDFFLALRPQTCQISKLRLISTI